MPNDITMTEITTSPKLWKVGYSVDAAGTKTKTLNTSGTFLDRNIGVEIITPSVSGSISGTASSGSAIAAITNVNNITTISNISGKTAGTDYWAIKATATGGNGSYTPKYTVSTAGWLGSTVTGTAQTVSVTSDTTGQFLYIPKATYGGSNGNITVTSAGYLPENEVIASMDTVTPVFKGGALNNKGASATGTNATLETTNNSGISILAKGTAGRDAVLYDGAVSGYVSASDNTVASAAVASSTWNGTTYYVKNVTVPSGKTFTVTNNGTLNTTNSGTNTITSGSKTAGNLTVAAYDTSSSSSTTSKSIVTNGVWTAPTVSSSGTYYGRVVIGSATLGSEGSVTMAPSVAVTNSTTMATTTTNTGYSFTVDGTPSNGTVQTKYKATAAGYTPIVNATNGGTVTVTPSVSGGKTVYIQAAVGSVTMTAGNGTCTYDSTNSSHVTVSDSDTSGVKVIFKGSGAVSATAKITTAGYTPTNNSFATGSSTSSNTASLTKYITGVELVAGKSFSITVPNGSANDKITFVFTVDSNNNVTVAES